MSDRTSSFLFSDESVDRCGDTIRASGWQLDQFRRNPVALWAHDSSSPPIGRASNVRIAGTRLLGDIEFMPEEISPLAETALRMVKAGFLNAVSVGFAPLEWKPNRNGGIDFVKQELLEISLCPVPANPQATVQTRAAPNAGQIMHKAFTLSKVHRQDKHEARARRVREAEWLTSRVRAERIAEAREFLRKVCST